ncbi:hypothetical protein BSZ14_05605 [Sphingomonas sp. Sph1(2015)]|jgi:hypothetical protein|nr:hypothetical protein BSZ14_05605 [Sphingomonas sp. Sph1(2015)]
MRHHAVMISIILTTGCSGEDMASNKAGVQPMLGAVMHSKPDEVRRLAEQGIGLNERDPANQSTPMIAAAETMQWGMVEVLIDHGADIWAYDQFGITAAQQTETSRVVPGSNEDQARLRVIAKLKARGYPFPPPKSDEVLELVRKGRWPPAGTWS